MSSIITVSRSAAERRKLLLVLLMALAGGVVSAAEPEAAAPLSLYERGDYATISHRPNPDAHTVVFIPALVSVLLMAEEGRGEPLTEAEVLALRDAAVVMAVPPESAARLEAGRGYRDVDPERCWPEWQEQRMQYLKH